MNNTKYITTTLPYVNSPGHIGHSFEFILADALARYFKFSSLDVPHGGTFFNLGLDEHGLKIQQTAETKGITPKEHVDEILYSWEDFLEKLQIRSWDSFYRTSDERHAPRVQWFWNKAVERGDIYKKKYTGKYCVGCESYKLDKDLEEKTVHGVDPVFDNPEVQSHTFLVCPDHPTTIIKNVEEENYFFKLSKYRNHLHEWAYKSTEFLEPKSKRAEFLNIIDSIEDISVSRLKETVSWGVPVPGDDTQTIYVWFDALLNYIASAGYFIELDDDLFDDHDFQEIWEESEVIQICGPDNLKFQAVIFQGLLASAGIKQSDKLLVHGTILDDQGRKMSKTLGNVIDPVDQVKKYGIEAVRYYTLAGLTTYGNSKWSESELVETHNSHLADDFGNLVGRVAHLAGLGLEKYSEDPNIDIDYTLVKDDKFCTAFDIEVEKIEALWDTYKVSEALSETNRVVKSLNKYITDEQPWTDLWSNWSTVVELHYCISKVNELYYPVIPGKVGEARKALRDCKKTILFPKLEKIS